MPMATKYWDMENMCLWQLTMAQQYLRLWKDRNFNSRSVKVTNSSLLHQSYSAPLPQQP